MPNHRPTNAALIAAAPTLLEALEQTVSELVSVSGIADEQGRPELAETLSRLTEIPRAAIARAYVENHGRES